MNMVSDISLAPMIQPTVGSAADLEHLGDQIAELSAHLDAASARLLDLIREFDARGGWNTGFVSCAAWLTWRVGLDRGAARERVRVARALGARAVADPGPRAWGTQGWDGRHRRARRAHRSRLAPGRSAGRSAGDDAAPRQPRAACVSRRRRYGRHPRAARAGGWRRACSGADLGPRHAVSAPAGQRERSRGNAHHVAAAGRRAGPHRGDGASPRHGSRHIGRAVPGRGSRRCRGPRGPGCTGPVGPRGRNTRSRGNVSAPGVRCEPSGDAPRR